MGGGERFHKLLSISRGGGGGKKRYHGIRCPTLKHFSNLTLWYWVGGTLMKALKGEGKLKDSSLQKGGQTEKALTPI